jgi:hypothetical protein
MCASSPCSLLTFAVGTVTVVERSVVVAVTVHGRVLPTADTPFSVRAVVSYVHMLVLYGGTGCI